MVMQSLMDNPHEKAESDSEANNVSTDDSGSDAGSDVEDLNEFSNYLKQKGQTSSDKEDAFLQE